MRRVEAAGYARGVGKARLFSDEVQQLCWHATRLGREGVEVVMKLLSVVPPLYHAEAMKLVWRDPPGNRMAWACMVAVAWRCGSRKVRRAAGTRERLVRWLEAADYGQPLLPMFREACGTRDELPPRLVVYRGGVGSAEHLAEGLAWSPCPTEAAWYAAWRWGQGDRSAAAAPVVVRRGVRREEVLWRWALEGGELLVASPGKWRVHTADPDRIRKLARTGNQRNMALIDQWSAIARSYNDGKDFWGGWGLEAEGAG